MWTETYTLPDDLELLGMINEQLTIRHELETGKVGEFVRLTPGIVQRPYAERRN